MLQSILNAAVAAGGLAFVGSLIDFVLSRRAKADLKAILEDWWLRFEYVTLRNFGHKEAEAAIAVLDRWAGPRLWSWKRWRFSLLVNLVLWGLASVSVLVRIWLEPSLLGFRIFEVFYYPLFFAPSIVTTFAVSLSATRYLAFTVGRLCTGTVLDVGLFLLLVLVHWLFLAYWSVFTYLLQAAPLVILGAIFNGWDQLNDLPWSHVLSKVVPQLLGGWIPVPNYGFSTSAPNEAAALLYKSLVDIVANLPRLGFALVFLASYLFRPLIQKPISWIWLRIVDSTLPFFTLAFGITGGLLKFGESLLS